MGRLSGPVVTLSGPESRAIRAQRGSAAAVRARLQLGELSAQPRLAGPGTLTNLREKQVNGPRDPFCVRSVLLSMRKACLLHRRDANSTASDRHPDG
jgi:hypothetical protein